MTHLKQSVPSPNSFKKYGGRIENWKEFNVQITSVSAAWIEGNLYDDPNKRFPEGAYIHTSNILKIDYENKTLETINTLYDLGEPYASAHN